MRTQALILLLAASLTACSSPQPSTPEQPPQEQAKPEAQEPETTETESSRLTEAEAIALAIGEAKRQGYDLEQYEPPTTSYSLRHVSWSVHFAGIVPRIGNHLSVSVGAYSGITRLHGGR